MRIMILIMAATLSTFAHAKNIEIKCKSKMPNLKSFILKSIRDLNHNGAVNLPDGNWVYVVSNVPFVPRLNYSISVNGHGYDMFTISEIDSFGRSQMLIDIEVWESHGIVKAIAIESGSQRQNYDCTAKYLP